VDLEPVGAAFLRGVPDLFGGERGRVGGALGGSLRRAGVRVGLRLVFLAEGRERLRGVVFGRPLRRLRAACDERERGEEDDEMRDRARRGSRHATPAGDFFFGGSFAGAGSADSKRNASFLPGFFSPVPSSTISASSA